MSKASQALETALLLIASIKQALSDGVEHYDLMGNRLYTVQEVLRALQTDKEIILRDPSKGVS